MNVSRLKLGILLVALLSISATTHSLYKFFNVIDFIVVRNTLSHYTYIAELYRKSAELYRKFLGERSTEWYI